MTRNEIIRYLAAVADEPKVPSRDDIAARIEVLKDRAVSRRLEEEAKELWILRSALQGQSLYLEAFELLGLGKFYDAWCTLERCDITLGSLEKHEKARWTLFRLDFIAEYVAKWQSIFPYKVFLSPAYIKHRKECSICGRQVLPRTSCVHRLGEIYNGRMCHHIVTDAELLEISLVENPVQKYSVAFPKHTGNRENGDSYNYATVEYARSAIQNPFDIWSVERTTKLWPHSHFQRIGRNDPCPCGSSEKYKKCCLIKEGVLMPHFQFLLSAQPPLGIPSEVLSLPSA